MPTREEVRAVARLARLSFTDAELERMAGDLRDILARAQEMRTVAAPAAAADESSDEHAAALRDDVPGADPLATPPSYLAPDWRDGFFAVPRLSAHGGNAP